MKFCSLVLLGGLDPKKKYSKKKKKLVHPGVKCILNAKNVASKSKGASARGTLHRMVPSHAKNAAVQLVGVPSTTTVGWGPRFSASTTGSADSCTQPVEETILMNLLFQTSLHN